MATFCGHVAVCEYIVHYVIIKCKEGANNTADERLTDVAVRVTPRPRRCHYALCSAADCPAFRSQCMRTSSTGRKTDGCRWSVLLRLLRNGQGRTNVAADVGRAGMTELFRCQRDDADIQMNVITLPDVWCTTASQWRRHYGCMHRILI